MKAVKRLLGWVCGFMAFAGAIAGFFLGIYLAFDFVFSGVFESMAKVFQHGTGSSKDEIRNAVMWLFIVWGSKLLIPVGGIIGMVIGWFTGYFLIEYTE